MLHAMKLLSGAFTAAWLAAALAARAPAAPGSCEALTHLELADTTITAAEPADLSKILPPSGRGDSATPSVRVLPPFCRVAATIKPSSDSDIKVEVWMPVSGWNGKLEAVGNGGWAGTINYPLLAAALRRGYAAVSTDTGHSGNGGDASFALGHREKLVDFAWRAVHM